MYESLKNKKALITGGSAGIGRAIAELYALCGASVALYGTNAERGQSVVEAIGRDKAQFYMVDVASKKSVEETTERALKDFGSFDILVNNAGIVRDALLMKMTEEEWDAVLDANLKSLYNLCHCLVRHFIKARSGKIINISSVIGLTGNAGQVNYAASKAGMIGFTKSLAKELAARNVQVNCIAPGFIETGMTQHLSENVKQAILQQIPMGRMGAPQEIASAALFLASQGSNYITGQVLTVDGGMVM